MEWSLVDLSLGEHVRRLVAKGSVGEAAAIRCTPYTLHPTSYTDHTPYTLPDHTHHILYTLHPTPYTLHPTPCTLHPTPYTLHPTPETPNRNSLSHRARFGGVGSVVDAGEAAKKSPLTLAEPSRVPPFKKDMPAHRSF